MTKTANKGRYNQSDSQVLLAALSEDLALPLIQIRSVVEVLKNDGWFKDVQSSAADQIDLSLESGLQLIEAYKLALRVSEDFQSVVFEPLAIGGVLDAVAHELTPYAQLYNSRLEVSVSHRLRPVLAHLPSLRTTIMVLGTSIIRAQSSQAKKSGRVLLGASAQSDSVVSAGVFSSINGLSDKALRGARQLAGRARQPLPAMPPGAASGVLIADMLCSSLWQPLRTAAHSGLRGLAINIPVSKQLQII